MLDVMLGKVPVLATIGAILFIILCTLLILIVLLQKGRGDGLASAFGGAGGQSAFGSKTGDMLTWVTVGFAVAYLFMGSLLSRFYKSSAYEEVPAGISSTAPEVIIDEEADSSSPDATTSGGADPGQEP